MTSEEPGRLPAPEPALERPPPPDAGEVGERKHVTAVLVRVEVTDPTAAPEVVERVLDVAGSVVREHVRQAGGRNHGSLGSLLLALFGTAQTREDDVHRAIRMALELAGLAQEGVRLRVAVAGGDALVSRSAQGLDDGPDRLGVSGHLLDTAVELIAEAKPGLVRVCRNTRLACADDFDFSSAGPASCGYDVALRTRFELANRTELPLVQRDRELRQLDARVEDVQRRRRPHLVTVLGPPGIGKSRLMHEFRRQISERPGIRCLVGCNRGFGRETPYDALAGVVRSYAGITDDDPLAVRDRKLEAAVAGLVGSEPIAAQLEENLRDLVARKRERRDAGKTRPADSRAAFAAWRRFVEELAARETVVIILEDLDRIDDELLEFVGDLAENVGDLPLLVVGTARPELAHRTPYWAGGARNATTMSLEPLSRAATATLLGSLLPEPADERDARRRTALADQTGGNPLFAIEFARAVEAVGEGPPSENPAAPGGAAPLPVHNIVAARIDTLPDREKRVLYDAALMTGSFSEKVLAALGGQDSTDIQDCLRTLERHGFLRRCRLGPELGNIEYTFVHELVRKVACSRLPHGVRAQRYREAADWLSAQPDAPGDQLVHHFHQAVAHAEQAGLPTRELSARACDRLVSAGQAAARRGAAAAADDCYRAALTFCTPDHPRRELLLRWQESASGASPE
ncbi:AAA family ATPase [Streptomyces sp. MN03-5084-2B]|nr:AAA family ATPase [Streptomyces sp. MN03-5084-2B]